MTTIHWFSHSHENRNDWLRFGLMQLATKNQIRFNFWDLDKMVTFGFSPDILTYPDLRHKSFILVDNGLKKTKCLVDSEDSFVLFSELIEYVDIYFCAGYNSDVFVHKRFPRFYTWQTEADLKWYKAVLTEKIDTYQQHFYKIRKFIPIAPNLTYHQKLNPISQRIINMLNKCRKKLGYSNSYYYLLKGFKKRYQQILSLRTNTLKYDIVANDSLWGWPKHRISLHHRLRILSNQGYIIHSELNYNNPSTCDDSVNSNLKKDEFPISLGQIEDYEKMMASAKLGVFACGFHWGWRNILSLALFIGLPILTDRLLTEAYFDLDEFKMWESEDHDWNNILPLLEQISDLNWSNIKTHNQSKYDEWLSPTAVARYFIKQSLKTDS